MNLRQARASTLPVVAFGIFLALLEAVNVPVVRGHGAEEHAAGHHGGQVLGTVVASEAASLSVKTASGETIRVLSTNDTRITRMKDTPVSSTIEPGTRVAIRLKGGEGPATAEEIRVGTK